LLVFGEKYNDTDVSNSTAGYVLYKGKRKTDCQILKWNTTAFTSLKQRKKQSIITNLVSCNVCLSDHHVVSKVLLTNSDLTT